MKSVTFVYEVVDEAEAAKINPLDFQHHGLRCTGFVAWDAMKTVEAAHQVITSVANIKEALKTLAEG